MPFTAVSMMMSAVSITNGAQKSGFQVIAFFPPARLLLMTAVGRYFTLAGSSRAKADTTATGGYPRLAIAALMVSMSAAVTATLPPA